MRVILKYHLDLSSNETEKPHQIRIKTLAQRVDSKTKAWQVYYYITRSDRVEVIVEGSVREYMKRCSLYLDISQYEETRIDMRHCSVVLDNCNKNLAQMNDRWYRPCAVLEIILLDLDVWCSETLPDAPSILGNMAGISVCEELVRIRGCC